MEKLTDKEKFEQNQLINDWAEQTANAYGLDLMEVKDDQIISFLAQKQVRNNGVLDDVKECLHPFNKVVSGDEGDFCTGCQKYLKTNRL